MVPETMPPAPPPPVLQLFWLPLCPTPGVPPLPDDLMAAGSQQARDELYCSSLIYAENPDLSDALAPVDEAQLRKRQAMGSLQAGLERLLGLEAGHWRHAELATPRGWQGWTGRPYGWVGGLGQHPSRYGPFGLATRTPLPGLWLCGDSLHPGEGTAGVSASAAMVCRQLLQRRHDGGDAAASARLRQAGLHR
jgi:phytoene dehydrogenase-like protein